VNYSLLLKAVKEVKEIGYLTPNSLPPDLLGVLLNHVSSYTEPLDIRCRKMRDAFELTSEDFTLLLKFSERSGEKETPSERRDRLLDYFAGRLEDSQR